MSQDITKLTNPKLIALAKELNIEVGDNPVRAELEAKILKAQSGDAPESKEIEGVTEEGESATVNTDDIVDNPEEETEEETEEDSSDDSEDEDENEPEEEAEATGIQTLCYPRLKGTTKTFDGIDGVVVFDAKGFTSIDSSKKELLKAVQEFGKKTLPTKK